MRRAWARVVMVGALLLVLYGAGLRNGFTLDDHPYLEQDARLRSLEGLRYLFFHPVEEGDALRAHLYRPLAAVVEAAIGAAFGFTPLAFHAANLALYGALGLLLYALLARWLPEAVASWATLLFLVHPVHVEAVASAAGITELLAALLVVAALERFLPRGTGESQATDLPPGRDAAGGLLVLAALLCKETVVLLPLLGLARGRHRGRLFAVLGAAVAAYFALRFRVIGGLLSAAALQLNPLDNPLCALGPLARAANGAVLLLRSLGLLLFPFTLSADYSLGSLPVLPAAWGLGAAAVHLGLLAAAWRLRWPGLALGLAVFHLGLLPTSNLLFCSGTIFGERFLLLPALALALPAAELAVRRPRLRPLLALLAVLLAGRTLARVPEWKDDLTLFESARRAYPDNAKANYNVAVLRHERGEDAAALPLAERAVAVHPGYGDARVLLARLLRARGEPARAEEVLRAGVQATPLHESLWVELGAVRLERAGVEAAGAAYREGHTRLPASATLALNLALAELEQGRLAEAEPLLREVLARVDLPDAHAALGHVLLRRGAYREAARESERALASPQRGGRAREEAALAWLLAGEPAAALDLLRAAGPSLPAALVAAAALRRTGEASQAADIVQALGLRSAADCPGTSPLREVCVGLLAR